VTSLPPRFPSAAVGRGRLPEQIQETRALTRRLFLQMLRRPSSAVVGVIQPMIWLALFGSLFAQAPAGLLPHSMGYGRFLAAGVIVFAAFSGALNAGLPMMFDREFGFLNRILVAPLRSRSSIVLASVIQIATLSLIQSLAIMLMAGLLGFGWPSGLGIPAVFVTLGLLVFTVTSLSLGLAFALPGHIELLAVTFVINLPLLFASTALAPLQFMPVWMRWLASLNPLTFAIEPIRAAYAGQYSLTAPLLNAPYGQLSAALCLLALLVISGVVLLLIRPLLYRKLS